MHRFPNPSSTIGNFVAVFVATFDQYHDLVFDLDAIVQATVRANLATSSGHMGELAISRSTRRDRSRDPLYNQMKMYAELFRSLGWLRSTKDSALNYTVTLLGKQLVEARQDWRPLLGETALGIAYPSHVLKVQHNHEIRPFVAILRTMRACNDGLSRDEMILGPLSAASDRTTDDFEAITARVAVLRDNPAAVTEALANLGEELEIQVNTMRNYTRWPLAVMHTLGWTSKVRVVGRTRRPIEIHRLTPLGKQTADHVSHSVDIRADQVDGLPFEQRRSLSRHAHFSMLDRTGFDVSSSGYSLIADNAVLRKALRGLAVTDGRPILFSPFQSLSIDDSIAVFPENKGPHKMRCVADIHDGPVVGRGPRDHLFLVPNLVALGTDHQGDELDVLKSELQAFRDAAPSLDAAARAFAASREDDTQTEFYPVVVQLLRLLGFDSATSRAGVNYQRWDAYVSFSKFSAPIEIKSPTEEMFLSTKAVRQAIENKVILLARRGLPTTRELTSLIIGYQIPNERGDLSTLIEDVHTAFGFNIGVLDLRTLGLLAIRAVTDAVSIDEEQLSHLKGFLSV